ncbi:golgin subfamily A member 6-like protein 22 [Aplysia californica]|uniref:Golgin subfamily A member 6-like protein 22 n=1 Tax=Aplysia californica TaxID=6500 RepID=A0ABM1W0Y6_APLCA|nr:golgin subfamily A member 6-like protein 22 [Aplysia californica]
MNFESPLLPVPEILAAFRESDVNLNENDLSRPDPRRWREIYGQIFEWLTSRSIEQATQSLCRTLPMRTTHPELYEEGFAQMAFTLCMQRVLCSCGFESFSVEDVIAPTAQRSSRILSAFINFSRHSEIRRAFADEEKQNIERSRGEYDSVVNRQRELKSKLAKMNETREQRETEKQQLQEEQEQAKRQMMELGKQQEAELRSVDELKLLLSEREKLAENLKHQISEVQLEIEKLSSKIIHSPERYKQEQERLQKRVHELKEELARKEQILSENRQLLEQTEGKRLAAERAVKTSVEVQGCLDKENEVASKIQKVMERRNELRDKHNQLYKQQEDLAEKLTVRQEQKRQIFLQTDINKQHQHQKLTDLRQYKEKKEEDMRSLKAAIEQVGNKTSYVLQEANEIDRQVEEEKQEWQKEFTEQLNEIDAVHSIVADGFADFRMTMTDN